jgi:hypothetical protein
MKYKYRAIAVTVATTTGRDDRRALQTGEDAFIMHEQPSLRDPRWESKSVGVVAFCAINHDWRTEPPQTLYVRPRPSDAPIDNPYKPEVNGDELELRGEDALAVFRRLEDQLTQAQLIVTHDASFVRGVLLSHMARVGLTGGGAAVMQWACTGKTWRDANRVDEKLVNICRLFRVPVPAGKERNSIAKNAELSAQVYVKMVKERGMEVHCLPHAEPPPPPMTTFGLPRCRGCHELVWPALNARSRCHACRAASKSLVTGVTTRRMAATMQRKRRRPDRFSFENDETRRRR